MTTYFDEKLLNVIHLPCLLSYKVASSSSEMIFKFVHLSSWFSFLRKNVSECYLFQRLWRPESRTLPGCWAVVDCLQVIHILLWRMQDEHISRKLLIPLLEVYWVCHPLLNAFLLKKASGKRLKRLEERMNQSFRQSNTAQQLGSFHFNNISVSLCIRSIIRRKLTITDVEVLRLQSRITGYDVLHFSFVHLHLKH